MKGFLTILILSLIACKEAKRESSKSNSAINRDYAKSLSNDKANDNQLDDTTNNEVSDSIRFSKIENFALEIATKNKHKQYYKLSFDTATFDNYYGATVDIEIGNFFEKTEKHLLIRTHVFGGAITNIYSIKKDSFELILPHDQADMSYVRDTIQDINGDSYKDFLVHSYATSGCCRRDAYNVYLYLPGKGFTSDYRFMNPTFFPEAKTIRGVEYGHPGEAGLYKLKWKNLKVEEVEFIYAIENEPGYFIKTKHSAYRPTEKEGLKIKGIPKEYRSIQSIDWFGEGD